MRLALKKRCDPAPVSGARERAPRQTCRLIVASGNHYLGALKGNQGNLHKSVQAHFVAEASYTDISKGHGRIEHRTVSLCTTLEHIPDWPGLQTLIRVASQRQFKKGGHPRCETETRYYVASLIESAEAFAQRIRGYWGSKIRCIMSVMSLREKMPLAFACTSYRKSLPLPVTLP